MKISVIGTGYVGLVSGTCFASLGHDVICIDNDEKKIRELNEEGILPIYEPDLEELVTQCVESGKLTFTTDTKAAVAKSDIVFIAVGTPPRADNKQADLKYVYQVAEEIGQAIDGYTVVVNKSTVPVGTADEVTEIIKKFKSEDEFEVVSNPEFLREGFAIKDFLEGDRVAVGLSSEKARQVMKQVYLPLEQNDMPVIYTDPKSAEMAKYAANTALAIRICFINEIADLCEKVGANIEDVAYIMGLDSRIGLKFLKTGPGFGGSCFPKDIMALEYTGRQYGCNLSLVKSMIESNNNRKQAMAEKISLALGGDLEGRTIGILGLAFKGNTDDCRESPAIAIIKVLQQMGANIVAYDPEAMDEAKHLLNGISYAEDSYSVCDNAEALIILTEWDEFAELDLQLVKSKLQTPMLIDLRNLYEPSEVRKQGLVYHSIGRV